MQQVQSFVPENIMSSEYNKHNTVGDKNGEWGDCWKAVQDVN